MLGKDALQKRTAAGFLAGLPGRIEKARAEGEQATDPQQRADAAQRVAALEAYRKELADLQLTAPALTFADRLTLWLGAREIRLLHLGRGHTAGDVVVFLPRERIVCTGDLFNGYIGYMGDAYLDEWPDTLERLAALDFETVIPGHGAPFTGKEKIAPVQACPARHLAPGRGPETRGRSGRAGGGACRPAGARVAVSAFLGDRLRAARRPAHLRGDRRARGGPVR